MITLPSSAAAGPSPIHSLKPALAALAALLAGLLPPAGAAVQHPNVLLILIDNQSYWELSCHGSKILQTPNIDQLQSQSVDFTDFNAPPFCSPSRAELLTGRYALRSGVHDTIGGVSMLNLQEATLANYFDGAGYRTAIFGKWHLGDSFPFRPMDRGFQDAYFHLGGGLGQLPDYFGNNHMNATWDHNGTMVKSHGWSTDVLFAQAEKFIRESKGQPFFCFLSTPAVHFPVQANPPALARLKARGVTGKPLDLDRDSMIEDVDVNVGKILRKLDAWGLAKNTIVIFTTDQGMQERAAPHPRPTFRRPSDDVAYDTHHTVYCMVRDPGVTKAGSEPALAGMVDLAPTLLDLCGLPVPDSMDGRSLRPLLEGAKQWPDDRTLIIQCPRQRFRAKWVNAVVKTQRWRLVGGNKLYDVTKDPGEIDNVASFHPDVVDRLTEVYNQFWETLPPAADLLSRPELGSPRAPDVRLDAMDWYRGAEPWTQGGFIHNHKSNGVWAVKVMRDGLYQFELRWYPREAPHPIGAVGATIRIGQACATRDISPQAEKVVFDLRLHKGDYDLETAFRSPPASGDTRPWGAYFVYVSYLGQ